MTNLDSRIDAWRRSMARAAGHRPELLAELETHLRDEIQRLIDNGASAEQAFNEAVSRLGSAEALRSEYDKLACARCAWLPVKIAWIIALLTAVGMAAFLVPKIGEGRLTVLLGVHVWSVTLGYLAMFLMGGLGICYMCVQWFSGGATARRDALVGSIARLAATALPLTGLGIVLGAIWARDHLGRYWGWDAKETGAVLVLGWAALMLATRWLKSDKRSAIIWMSLVGNMVTAWAWFGANALSAKVSPPALLYTFIAVHLVLLLTGFLPIWRRREA